MLYFSEGGWTLSEMSQVKEAFVRDYDEDEYERKIAGLVRRIYARDGSAEEIEAWNDATVRLSAADHYLLVSIDGASWRTKGPLSAWLPTSESRGKRPRGDWMRLTLAAVAVFALCAIVMLISSVFGR